MSIIKFPGIIKPGVQNPEAIKLIQKAVGVQQNGDLGPDTLAHIGGYQRAHNLPVKPEVDQQMWHVMYPDLTLRQVLYDLTRKYLGVREVPLGSNRGPDVDRWNRGVGNPLGSPWCAAYTYGLIVEACGILGIPVPVLRSGYVPTILAWAQEHHMIVTAALLGDLFLVKGEGSVIHITFAMGPADAAGMIPTNEGNTNDDGSSNGIGTFDRHRHQDSGYLVRWLPVAA